MIILVFDITTARPHAGGWDVKLQKITISEKMSFWQGNKTGDIINDMEQSSS
jgi:hypothetical protein